MVLLDSLGVEWVCTLYLICWLPLRFQKKSAVLSWPTHMICSRPCPFVSALSWRLLSRRSCVLTEPARAPPLTEVLCSYGTGESGSLMASWLCGSSVLGKVGHGFTRLPSSLCPCLVCWSSLRDLSATLGEIVCQIKKKMETWYLDVSVDIGNEVM